MNIGIKSKRKIMPKEEINIDDLLGIQDIKNGVIMSHTPTLVLEVLPVNLKLKSIREQNYIIKSYEELHKVLKTPFDIRTISRKEDSREHLEYIGRLAETEENESVKAMIEEYKSFVSEMAYKNAVKKRFIVYLPYVIPPGLKMSEIDWEDIERWLFEKGMQFIEGISKCGNKVVSPKSKSQFTAQILFELLNIKSSEKERVPFI